MIRSILKLQVKLALLPLKAVAGAVRCVAGGGSKERRQGAGHRPSAPATSEPAGSGLPSAEVVVLPAEILGTAPGGEQVVFVDIRQAVELADGRMIRGARHIPMQDLPRRVAELDPSCRIVLYSGSGARSVEAARFLREKGYARAVSLAGGVARWEAEGGGMADL